MSPVLTEHLFAFVWTSQEITPAVTDAAERTLTHAIFEVSPLPLPEAAAALKQAGAREIKIPLAALLTPDVPDLFTTAGISRAWVEIHPWDLPVPAEELPARLAACSGSLEVVPILGDPTLLEMFLNAPQAPSLLALKGSEAGGFGSLESVSVLYATARQLARQAGREVDLILWGGLAAPEAVAAFVGTGARGVVFESVHWLTDLAQAPPGLQEALARLRLEHTTTVGGALGLSCRLFDRGNSTAVKQLEQIARSLSADPLTPDTQREFARQVMSRAVPARQSRMSREEVIFLGPEAAWAGSFKERFGGTFVWAVQGFLAEAARLLREPQRVSRAFRDSAAARRLGSRYPFIQGAMTWISDIPEFARAVAEAGALPTVALGLRPRRQLEQDFRNFKEVLGAYPYALNLLTLQENPFLKEQLDWLQEFRPPFVVIAAGDPQYASLLTEKGLEVLYIATDEGLLRLALAGGVRGVILEGNEAGGHVGVHSTLTLAQMALELRRREPQLFTDRLLVLAGGIFDRETAWRAAMLGADAIQMGTVYLTTREIITTGALSRLYQDLVLAARPGDTTISGESVGLRVRSLRTPKIEAIKALERRYFSQGGDEAGFRRELEGLAAHSLLLAARGVERPGGPAREEEVCRREGQFMSGAVAGLIRETRTMAELHQELALGELSAPVPDLSRFAAPVPSRPASSGNGRERVAITGIALVNALGNTPQEIWQAVLEMKSGISEVPPSRWDHSLIYDPHPGVPEKTYCRVGAFQSINISRKELGLPPQDFRTMADSTRLTMYLAHQALKDSGILEAEIPRERVGVVISQNSGETASTLSDLVIGLSAGKIVRTLRNVVPMTPEQELAAERQIKAGCLTVDDTTLMGRLNCAAGGFISNKYGFMGPCYSVSAACATSLVAIYNAIQMIRNGVIDVAVVGGGEEYLSPAHFIEFSALGVLAGIMGVPRAPREASRPFDRYRDGIVLGEGGGMVVLERESVARKRGARIYAHIIGVGASNNHRGMVESLDVTQRLAIEGAFRDARISPETVDLVECHATGTVLGDREEAKALRHFFNHGRRLHLTSFKSQIGHTLGASGVNSLIRGILALNAGVIPANLNYQAPDPELALESGGFYVPTTPVDWPRAAHRPRRLMVNAFGFGGANFVALVEGESNGTGVVLVSPRPLPSPPPVAEPEPRPAAAPVETLEGVYYFTTSQGERSWRLAVVAPGRQEAQAALAALTPEDFTLTEAKARSLAARGIFLAPAQEPAPPLALVCAGQGTFYPGMGRELYEAIPQVRAGMEEIARLADFDLLDKLFHAKEEDLRRTLWQQPALYALEYGLVQFLLSLGVKPTALAGHSMGELMALAVAGVFSYEDGYRIVSTRARLMDEACRSQQHPGAMLAVDAPLEILKGKMASRPEVHFTNYNSPRQVVVGGNEEQVLSLQRELEEEGYWTARLRVSMAFHSPIMRFIRPAMADFIKNLEIQAPKLPVISNTTTRPYPDDPAEIREILLAHLEHPVYWTENVKTLWEDFGVRDFVEVGPKDTLCNLIFDTLPQARCLNLSHPEGETAACRAALARLYAWGHMPAPPPAPALPFPASPAPAPFAGTSASHPAVQVLEREISNYLRQVLKPSIVAAIRRELDPSFTEARLDALLRGEAPTAGVCTPLAAPEGAVPPVNLEGVDYVEEVIRLIMDATGYEREEIQPHMDIRQDLAIRSSRLPVIMDLARRRFGITVRVEDFMGCHTVQQLADRIALVVARDGVQVPSGLEAEGVSAAAGLQPKGEEGWASEAIQRLTFIPEALPAPSGRTLSLSPEHTVAVLALPGGRDLAQEALELLGQGLAADPQLVDLTHEFDLQTEDGFKAAAERLATLPGLAGVVLAAEARGLEDFPLAKLPGLLTGLFRLAQALAASPERTFWVAAFRGLDPAQPLAIAGEGAVGLGLAAAQEYESVYWRTLFLEADSSLEYALTLALDPEHHLVKVQVGKDGAYTLKAAPQPLSGAARAGYLPGPEDVVVISGGGRGIATRLAAALAPFRPRVVLLGRTSYEPVMTAEGATPGDQAPLEAPALEVRRTLEHLAALGLEASYYQADVTDQAAVSRAVAEIASRYGRIDLVLHSAGFLRDAFMTHLSPEDFAAVVQVKLGGALNLYEACRPHGLRVFAALSSVVAVQGNIGQANYACANRALAALVQAVAARDAGVRGLVLHLPPIEGTGMADSPEIKALLQLKGMGEAYVHADELGELFSRELVLGDGSAPWIMPVRVLPQVKTTRLELPPPESREPLTAAGVTFTSQEMPMIQRIYRLDLKEGVLEAGRTFSLEFDQWLDDHRPFRGIKHPIISGVMATETMLEGARLLYPHLVPRGVRRVQYLDIFEVPEDTPREARILGRRVEMKDGEVICRVAVTGQEITTTGALLNRWTTYYQGEVILGPEPQHLAPFSGFPLAPEELTTPPMPQEKVHVWYEQKGTLKGRYRVLDGVVGTGPQTVSGIMLPRPEDDFAWLKNPQYQYSPYLLEALMHLSVPYAMFQEFEPRNIIPAELGEVRFSRRVRPGERLTLEARLTRKDDQGITWDACVFDEKGEVILRARDITFRWFDSP
jgi:acyl transferase domain-containing protein/NAD(P)H-dependent flavin oxidoreductase YrpB (nitropropane dioxygenase family)/NAD(P)-dependent dehydrogenase (short-subunit alcohol dehydrogenase family)/acyl carrier protein